MCLCFQVPVTMGCVLQAALDLSTSTKPYDSVTAAHLLQLLLHQSELIPVLLRYAQDQGLDLGVGPPPAQVSETLGLELNALAGKLPQQESVQISVLITSVTICLRLLSVVQFLLRLLQVELSGAESSLLQASASFPLYGRAHCITAVLQHLKTE